MFADDDTPRYEVAVVDSTPALDAALDRAVAAIDGELELTACDRPHGPAVEAGRGAAEQLTRLGVT